MTASPPARQMTVGLVGRLSGSDTQPMSEHLAFLEEADDLGYHAFWLNEEHFQQTPRMGTCPLVVGSAIAARTRRMRIGTGVVLLPLHHPLHVAEQFATLDVLSEGRVDAGISRGGQQYAEAFGIDPAERHARFEEAVDILTMAFTAEKIEYSGQYYQIPQVTMQPRPVQTGGMPLYIATYDLETVRAYARRGLRALEGGVEPVEAVAGKIAAFEQGWQEGGHPLPAPPVPVTRMVYVGEDDASARAEVEPVLHKAYTGMKRLALTWGRDPEEAFEYFASEIAIIGGPDTVTRRLQELHDHHGVRYVNVLLHSFWDIPTRLSHASLRRLARYVMPQFSPVAG